MIKRIVNRLVSDRNLDSIYKNFFKDATIAPASGKRVLMYVGIGATYLTPTEVLLYHLLRQKGVEVDYLVYDESISICEHITEKVEREKGKDKFWNGVCRVSRKILNAAGVEYETIKESSEAAQIANGFNDLESILSFNYEGVDFGNIVEGALYRYYKSLSFGEDVFQVAKRMLTTAMTNYLCVQSKCEENDYDTVMMSHGIYVTWEPVVEFCKNHDLTYVCYDRAKTQSCANFNVNQPSPDWSFDAAWERYSDRKLSTEEDDQVSSYLKERELQKNDVYAYNFSSKADDVEQEKKRLGIPLESKCIVIYTNLIWDAANVSRDLAFESTHDCILKTVEHFKDRSDVQVVVRCHPAEKVLGTSEKYSELLRSHYGDNFPVNLTIVNPEDDVNSFTMIDITDVGVVNTSTVGLEIAMLGKPSVIISETHYRGKGFTLDVDSVDAYFNVVEKSLGTAQISDECKHLARKYFYMMMFLYQQKLPTKYANGVFEGYSVSTINELKDSERIVQIADQIASGDLEDFVRW